MEDAKKYVQRTVRYTILFTLVWFVLWALVPAWKSIVSGLAIGSAVSVYFAVSFARQAQMGAATAARGGKNKPIVPFVSRIAAIAVAVMIANKLSYPNVYALIFALLTYQVVIFVDMVVNRGQQRIPNRKG